MFVMFRFIFAMCSIHILQYHDVVFFKGQAMDEEQNNWHSEDLDMCRIFMSDERASRKGRRNSALIQNNNQTQLKLCLYHCQVLFC